MEAVTRNGHTKLINLPLRVIQSPVSLLKALHERLFLEFGARKCSLYPDNVLDFLLQPEL